MITLHAVKFRTLCDQYANSHAADSAMTTEIIRFIATASKQSIAFQLHGSGNSLCYIACFDIPRREEKEDYGACGIIV